MIRNNVLIKYLFYMMNRINRISMAFMSSQILVISTYVKFLTHFSLNGKCIIG